MVRNNMINYIQLRTSNLEQTIKFYEQCGLKFVMEAHGDGPIHYSIMLGTSVVEFYPTSPGSLPDLVSLGLIVDNRYPEELIPELEALGGFLISNTEYNTIMLDPDNRKIIIRHKEYGEKKRRDEYLFCKLTKPIEASFVNEPALKPKKDEN